MEGSFADMVVEIGYGLTSR